MSDQLIEVWTVGHSTRTIPEFAAALESQHITAIVDVRRFPASRRFPHFNQRELSDSLAAANVRYIHLPELGGRRSVRKDSQNTALRNAAFRGYADYMETADFVAGIARLLDVARAGRTAIMCAEALWWKCHRSLIADYLKAKGVFVTHIVSAVKTEPHAYTAAARGVDGELSYRGLL